MDKRIMTKRAVLTLVFVVLLMTVFGADNVLAADIHGNGFSLSMPENYCVEKTQDIADIVLGITSPQTVIRVYDQVLKNGVSAADYIEYGNKQLYEGKAGYIVLANTAAAVNGYRIREIGYCRPRIANIDDRNYYFEAHLVDSKKNVVITFWGKTTQDNYEVLKRDIRSAVKSFRWKTNQHVKTATPVSQETVKEEKEISLGEELLTDKQIWGRFYPGAPEREDIYYKMMETESQLNYKFGLLMTYCAFPEGPVFPEKAIKKAYADGRMLMLTLQPFTTDLNWVAVPEIIAGKYDRKIQEWAETLKDIGEPIFIRPLNEMNGDWDPWCSWYFGKDNELYILAWRHIVNIFRDSGADNVLFVWNPHDRSYPDFQWNNPHLYYPGDAYVDWVGLTGYNNGTSHPGDVWREFDEIYQSVYADYMKRYDDKPFMITEFSCNEIGGNKAAWIGKAMESLRVNYPNIKVAVWFDKQDNKWLYQLDSSSEAFAAFKRGLEMK